jgi:apolipoprotein N-acyltransferase
MLRLFRSYKTAEEKKQNRRELLIGFISGIALGASFPPIPLPYLIFVALIPYLFVVQNRKTLAEINRFTYFTAFFFNLITLYWVGSWTPDADPFLMVAGTVLMFFNPLVFLIPSTLYYFTRKNLNPTFALLLLPWFWLFYEYIYSVSDFKFPWLSLSNGLPYFTSYIQIADTIGSYGLTVLILYTNIFGYLSIRQYFKGKKVEIKYLLLFLLFLTLPIIYGWVKLNEEFDQKDIVRVGLIQPDLNPNKKWATGKIKTQIDLYHSLSTVA